MGVLLTKEEYKNLIDYRDTLAENEIKNELGKLLNAYNVIYLKLVDELSKKKMLAKSELSVETLMSENDRLKNRITSYKDDIHRIVQEKSDLLKENEKLKKQIKDIKDKLK